MPTNGYTLSIECILKEAKARWLKGYEVLCILQNYQTYGLKLSTGAPSIPPSGSLFLFNKRVVKFRKDGINWKKEKDGKTVRESHEKLKVGGVKVLSCSYTRSADNSAFQRRIYWLLDGDPVVLVHYLLIERESGASQAQLAESENEGQAYPLQEKEQTPPASPHSLNTEFAFGSTPNVPLNDSLMDFVNVLKQPSNSMDRAGSLPAYANGFPHNLLQQSILSREARNDTGSQPSTYQGGRLAKIMAFSPEWDYTEGGTKIIITGPDFKKGTAYYCMFDQTEVAAELLQDGVLRCQAPQHSTSGTVSFCVTRGNFMLFSEIKTFEYKPKPQTSEGMSSSGPNIKACLLERLEQLERHSQNVGRSPFPQNTIETLVKTLTNSYVSDEQFEQTCLKLAVGLLDSLDAKSVVNNQDKFGFTLLHCTTILQFPSLVAQLVQYGANPNLPDNTGNTAFFYAVKNRDQRMIKLLVDYVDFAKPAQYESSPPMEETRIQELVPTSARFSPEVFSPSRDSWEQTKDTSKTEEVSKLVHLCSPTFSEYQTRKIQQSISDTQKRNHEARSLQITELRK